MKHRKIMSTARLGRMVLLVGLGLQIPALACSVPVFRYALERWPPDTYRYVVFHDGPLTPDQQKWVDQLEQIKMLGYGRPTLLGYTVDVSQEIEELQDIRALIYAAVSALPQLASALERIRKVRTSFWQNMTQKAS